MYLITSQQRPSATRSKGFTLTEIIMALAVSGMVSMGAFSFFLSHSKIGFDNQARNAITAEVRGLTNRLMSDGQDATAFALYRSIAESDRKNAGDQLTMSQSGDLLVFVYTGFESGLGGTEEIERLVFYYRTPAPGDKGELGSVRRLERVFSPASKQELETLIPSVAELAEGQKIAKPTRGLSNGRFFYNFFDRSVILNGQILHGNDARMVTELYNLTITPRG